ncbi:hypothetical protein C9Z87_26070 (plasmid) [Escherichia coli]|nr:hypothetical protein [Escherichia coli]EFI4181282.1 hypothetical protein [Escherichia coli]EFI4191911.1 hypothetical protein [Escherichia coli]EGD9542402.1 hypothetical protein [Escherichia coli]MCI5400588.1 hypothetical protein [Escherichia coli]
MLGIGHLSRLFNQSQRYSLYDLLTSLFVVFYTDGQNHLNVHSGMASMNVRSVPEVGVTYPYPNITL